MLAELHYNPWNYTILHEALDYMNSTGSDPKQHVSQTNKNRRVKGHHASFSWIIDLLMKERSWSLFSCFFIYCPEELSMDIREKGKFTVFDRAAELGYWNEVEALLRWDGYKGLIMYLMRFNVMRHVYSAHTPLASTSVLTSSNEDLWNDVDSSHFDERCSGLAHLSVLDNRMYILGTNFKSIISNYEHNICYLIFMSITFFTVAFMRNLLLDSEALFIHQPWWRLRVLAALFEIAVSYRISDYSARYSEKFPQLVNADYLKRGFIPLECHAAFDAISGNISNHDAA
jgi:hypothetical protein